MAPVGALQCAVVAAAAVYSDSFCFFVLAGFNKVVAAFPWNPSKGSLVSAGVLTWVSDLDLPSACLSD
jgi:hypothetical protein